MWIRWGCISFIWHQAWFLYFTPHRRCIPFQSSQMHDLIGPSKIYISNLPILGHPSTLYFKLIIKCFRLSRDFNVSFEQNYNENFVWNGRSNVILQPEQDFRAFTLARKLTHFITYFLCCSESDEWILIKVNKSLVSYPGWLTVSGWYSN